MREIKFRAWVPKLKRMGKVSEINFMTGTLAVANNPIFSEIFRLRQVRLMQYTGLKDMNGVEIYECDIVQVNYSGNDDFSGLALVVFRNGCFELEGKIMKIINSEGIMYDDFYAISNDLSHYSACVKVIGNKFKNPKLMETVL